MDRPSLSDDIVAWAEEQAAALGARGELSNVLDWENLAEKFEGVGGLTSGRSKGC